MAPICHCLLHSIQVSTCGFLCLQKCQLEIQHEQLFATSSAANAIDTCPLLFSTSPSPFSPRYSQPLETSPLSPKRLQFGEASCWRRASCAVANKSSENKLRDEGAPYILLPKLFLCCLRGAFATGRFTGCLLGFSFKLQ